MADGTNISALAAKLSVRIGRNILFLQLKENQHVIVDEKAGADGASTGIPTGMDFAVIVVEPTPHGIKAGKQNSTVA